METRKSKGLIGFSVGVCLDKLRIFEEAPKDGNNANWNNVAVNYGALFFFFVGKWRRRIYGADRAIRNIYARYL